MSGNTNNQNRAPIDILDPLFLHSSDHPGMLLVTKQMDGTNFGSWKKSMSIALSAKNKLTFVQGLIAKPVPGDVLISNWQRCNDMVTSWILNALAPDIADSVLFSNTASQIWTELEDRHGQASGAKLYQLHKEAISMEQGTSDIAGYYSKFKKIHDEYASLRSFPPCTCGHIQALLKYEEEERLIQFLMGLNSSYNAIRGNILMMKPLPSMNQAYAILVQEEKQREMHSGNKIETESAAFIAEQYKNSRGNSYGYQSNTYEHNRGSYRRPNVVCTYCKKPGHTANRCYKLTGYPKESQYARGRGRRIGASVLVETNEQQHTFEEGNKPDKVDLSTDEYNQLMQLLSKSQSSGINTSSQSISYAHFAGPFNGEPSGTW